MVCCGQLLDEGAAVAFVEGVGVSVPLLREHDSSVNDNSVARSHAPADGAVIIPVHEFVELNGGELRLVDGYGVPKAGDLFLLLHRLLFLTESEEQVLE